MSSGWRHWRVSSDDEICWLTFDKAESTSNTLSSGVLDELNQVLDWVEQQTLRGVVFKSAKPTGFILGADVSEFGQLEDADQATEAAARGQRTLARIEDLKTPTVAAIDGYALGGGLELALACTYRLAVKGYERTLGLPEVQLGIHPGFGGTVRAVQLLGPFTALDMMLTGRSSSPMEALASGLVDRVVEPDELDAAAKDLIDQRPHRRRASLIQRLANLAPFRAMIAPQLRKKVAKRARREHYPAPFAIVDLWQRYGASGRRAYRAEVESIGQLLVTPTCKNLVRIFELRERLRNLAPKEDAIAHVHVVGAGIMGGDIAAWCALRGLEVSLQDRALEFITPALERARKLFSRRLKAPGAARDAEQRLVADLDAERLASADIVIEAIIEDRDIKRGLFADIEKKAKPDAVMATNTSSIRIEDIASALQDPTRLVGIHFFNPVAQLPLVEVIRGENSSPTAVAAAMSFVTQIGKLPLPCSSAPGFVVNRVLMPYMLEALLAVEDGHALETVDAAAKRFGMPMGPIELADRVGLDVALSVADILSTAFDRQTPATLRTMVDAGRLGVKCEQGGFYRYDKGRPRKTANYAAPDDDLVDRLILPLVNECMACLSDGVVDDADLLDAGVVFGTGFAPHTGGPMQYAGTLGHSVVAARLSELQKCFGVRFQPHPGWQK